MSVASMTGFARAEGRSGGYGWSWEVKSVNARSLDVRPRLPTGMEALDPALREAISKRFSRGNFVVHLLLARDESEVTVRVNRTVLDQVRALAGELEGSGAAPPRADGLLALRGVMELVEPEESAAARAEREAAMIASLSEALDGLASARRQEGARLAEVLVAHLSEMARLADAAGHSAGAQPETIRARFKEGVAAALEAAPALSEERLEHEIAILVNKADVREELDRLRAHVAAARELIEGDAPSGRRLDFLAQELNREANTLCAKSADVELTRIGLDLKAAIDQFREQVQNIE